VQDYRDLDEKFDRIVSVGMCEHVGPKNYRTYFNKIRSQLRDDGLFLLHTIGNNVSVHMTDRWMARYIFPNSVIPSMAQIARACEGLFAVEDWHNIGVFYDTTLMAWYRNFEEHWPALQKRYDERFYRMWKYYLLSCAGSFRSRYCHVWQMLLSPNGIPGGYESIRESVYKMRHTDRGMLSQPMNSYIEYADNQTMHTPSVRS
jgi:cyclopropane-fatty-acyl-phospholipid synthase